ncbi:MAG: WD40 repeat domain-containing protein, partial [Myxococcota bacterium]
NRRRAKLKAALSKLGARVKDKKKTKPKQSTGSLPRPGKSLPSPSSDGEDTPAAELDFDLGIGDDLVDTLDQLMPQDTQQEEKQAEEPARPVSEAPESAPPGSEVQQDKYAEQEKSLLIELVDVVEEPDDEEEEIVGPDPNYQSGETLTSIRPMSLASEAEETPGLRLPRFGGGARDEDEDQDEGDEPASIVDEPALRESGDEITPATDVSLPEEVPEEEDATKQVSAADLQFIRSGAGQLSPKSERESEDLAMPSLQSETEAEHAAETSQPSMVHSELADIWTGRSAAGVFGKGIVRPSPEEYAEFYAGQTLDTSHRWIYGVGRLVERGLVCVCGDDDTVSIFDESGAHLTSLRVPEDGLNDIAVVSLGSVLFAAGDDGYIYAWTLPTGSLEKTDSIERAAVSGHDGWVTSLDVDVDHQLLVSGSFDGTARVWALDGSADPLVLDGHDGAVSGVAMTARGPVTVGHDGTVRFWTNSGLQVDQLDAYGKVLSVKSGPDMVAWTCAGGEVYVRDSEGVRELVPHDTQATTAAIDERGAIASADKRGEVRLYAPGASEPFQTLELDSAVWAMHLTASQLTVGTDAGQVRFFERE